jgi:urea transporter
MICWGGGNGAANNADRVLDAPTIDWCRHEQPHKIQRLSLLALLAVEMPAAGHRQMRAWRVRNHQIPFVAQHLLDWLLQVPSRIAFAWQQVTTPPVMPMAAERIADPSAVFAGNEYPHSPCRLASRAW